jgi:hypothetical protein
LYNWANLVEFRADFNLRDEASTPAVVVSQQVGLNEVAWKRGEVAGWEDETVTNR